MDSKVIKRYVVCTDSLNHIRVMVEVHWCKLVDLFVGEDGCGRFDRVRSLTINMVTVVSEWWLQRMRRLLTARLLLS